MLYSCLFLKTLSFINRITVYKVENERNLIVNYWLNQDKWQVDKGCVEQSITLSNPGKEKKWRKQNNCKQSKKVMTVILSYKFTCRNHHNLTYLNLYFYLSCSTSATTSAGSSPSTCSGRDPERSGWSSCSFSPWRGEHLSLARTKLIIF